MDKQTIFWNKAWLQQQTPKEKATQPAQQDKMGFNRRDAVAESSLDIERVILLTNVSVWIEIQGGY